MNPYKDRGMEGCRRLGQTGQRRLIWNHWSTWSVIIFHNPHRTHIDEWLFWCSSYPPTRTYIHAERRRSTFDKGREIIDVWTDTHTERDGWMDLNLYCIILYCIFGQFPYYKNKCKLLLFRILCGTLLYLKLILLYLKWFALAMLEQFFQPFEYWGRGKEWERERVREWEGVRESERACSLTMWIYNAVSQRLFRGRHGLRAVTLFYGVVRQHLVVFPYGSLVKLHFLQETQEPGAK